MMDKSFSSLTLLPLGQCVPAQCGINKLQNKLLNHCDLMVPKELQIWSRGREILLCKAPKTTSPLPQRI